MLVVVIFFFNWIDSLNQPINPALLQKAISILKRAWGAAQLFW